MLERCGIAFEVAAFEVDESVQPGESPETTVRRLAAAKACAAAERFREAWVIGADTVVAIDGEVLGKPRDGRDAAAMLGKLSGRRHEVWGAYAIDRRSAALTLVEAHVTEVQFTDLTESQIEKYLATGEPGDKAGAYAIQGYAAQFVAEVKGSYTNVVGLNIAALLRTLRKLGAIE